ncbi:Phosphotyrosyl phosphatase activator [Gonapodya prolifera JEL478]|uniref:Serine/threonine-protein phosphatase 2A activator n=1 Tax=Gonapodya prolifera (strain JEL478) TaxID=1344416 RepID=A0A139AL19_GONPJ|nr:Phosphotyrosyl phosphatase activator [Gonapodya prolifera JEL478]|eukprot:KXS17501.1 Phosphotyrosyl phosphatase activator [Gonapodya prolifera JEL478]
MGPQETTDARHSYGGDHPHAHHSHAPEETGAQHDCCADSHSPLPPSNEDGLSFRQPRREILTPEDLEDFLASQTLSSFLGFVLQLNESVRNKKTSADVPQTEVITTILGILDELHHLVEDTPVDTSTNSRFGNPSFRVWLDKVNENLAPLHQRLVPFGLPEASIVEVSTYFISSFGDRQRIDYGTGHEAAFVTWLYCLSKLGLVTEQDYPALVLKVFFNYISLMRELQFTYWLEPAGSHGVWGLDDYHFLPFMFGSSQLYDHKHIKPKSIHNSDIIAEFSKEYMYLACIQFINSVKTATLRWHSPMLDDISGVKSWQKVNGGMVKMYRAEVLGKLPIMQHFLFGSILSFKGSGGRPELDVADEHFHVYALGQQAPVCCGMRIPSSIAGASARNGQNGTFIPMAGVGGIAGGGKMGSGAAIGGRTAETGYLRPMPRPLPFD